VATELVVSAAASLRIDRAAGWLRARAPGDELLVVAPNLDSANELLRACCAEGEFGASFGWHRATLPRVAAQLAADWLAEAKRVPVGRLAATAVVARAVRQLAARGELGRFAPAANAPGFCAAVAATLDEIRCAHCDPAALAQRAPDLARLLRGYEAELAAAGLADRAEVLARACEAAQAGESALLGLPLLLLDLPVASAAERELLRALAHRSPCVLATAAAGDETALSALGDALCVRPRVLAPEQPEASALARLQRHLFDEVDLPPRAELDASLPPPLSAPGENRECVELARCLVAAARDGLRFDRMAILLRSPEEYRPHLEEALARAGIPAHFATGARRPDPAGRAFLALLDCAASDLSALRFSEYLSLGQVPDPDPAGTPPPAPDAGERWVAPDGELLSERTAAALRVDEGEAPSDAAWLEFALDPDAAPASAGTLRAPRRWEELIVEAAVIGGLPRWQRRLDGLARELEHGLVELADDDPRRAQKLRARADLRALADFALPLLGDLAALPASARWGEWLGALSALATRALREPTRVLAVLAELEPLAEVGPVEIGEVRRALAQRLLEIALPPAPARYGKVFVAPIEAARGLAFDLVCIPGLAEKLFPRRIAEDPILLDATREALRGELAANPARIARERLAFRLAVGAACERVILSYPRLDLDQGRPRVPSFYALEALRAAEGFLPGFDELAARAENVTHTRVGWPAPRAAADAIDTAEHDLALLDRLLAQEADAAVGTARYLLDANPHLGRALRFRARRWLANWTPADGLVAPARGELLASAREAIAEHQIGSRSFSPTALQHYAACPYRFFLQAVHRLAPREEPTAIDEMDALQKGSLVHDALFELFQRLGEAQLLPVDRDRLPAAARELDAAIALVAERFREELAPAIPRVFDDSVAAIRADLREWLRRASEDASGFVPWRFELSFGLSDRRARDARSQDAPVKLACGLLLRGSIDLVERREAPGAPRLRVTDHKTGKSRIAAGSVIAGGESLQPVLYALALEQLEPGAAVESGRLSYCTSAGGFSEVVVPLDERARHSAERVARAVDRALAEPFLPAAPAAGACRWCDYQSVCGPYEELRAGRKPGARLAALREIRELP
jgi:CRISPR/Cas system-associated exonuclease Cas4 (RecB family)